MRNPTTAAPALAAIPLLLLPLAAACGGGGNNFSAECPIGLVEQATSPVRVTFWHSMTVANRDTIERLVSEFNASHDKIQVEAVFQGTYDESATKYFTSLRGGDVPDLVQIEDTGTQRMIDSGSVARAQDCVDAEGYDLSDYLERVIAYYRVEGELWPYPFNVSSPVLYYNRTAFERAGLDPNRPPATLEEIRDYSRQLVDSGVVRHGVALELAAWHFEQWLAKEGEPFVDNDNGRAGRATRVLFGNDAGRAMFQWLDSMVDDGLAVNVGRNPSGADTLLAIGSGDAAMTIATSAAMRSVFGVLESGEFPDVTVGVAPMPGISAQDRGGIEVGGAALWVVNRSPAAEQEAARIFAQWLNAPEQQAAWHVGSGYIPIRVSAAGMPAVQELWSELPHFRVAYDQLLAGELNIASAGSVIGPYEEVREAILNAMEQMLLQGKDPDAALDDAVSQSDDAIEAYNSRVGR
jgi:sn-glycerol 3-phosphate transport system substrate-binding protein